MKILFHSDSPTILTLKDGTELLFKANKERTLTEAQFLALKRDLGSFFTDRLNKDCFEIIEEPVVEPVVETVETQITEETTEEVVEEKKSKKRKKNDNNSQL